MIQPNGVGPSRALDAISYIIAQCIGALVGAGLLVILLKGKTGGYNIADGLGQIGWKDYDVGAVRRPRDRSDAHGVHLGFITVSGCSVNPARSLGPAVFVGGTAIKQLWLYLVMPTIAGAVSGWLVKAKLLDT